MTGACSAETGRFDESRWWESRPGAIEERCYVTDGRARLTLADSSRSEVVIEKGDWVSYALALVGLCLWTAIILRALSLRGLSNYNPNEPPRGNTMLAQFVREAARLKTSPARLAHLLKRTKTQLESLRGLITTLVAVAPLLGLLGTVIGMVEMFGSMQGALGPDGESTVAGGISTALVTTQLGLVIAAPGLVASYFLTRLQVRREHDLKDVMRSLQGSS